MKKKFETIRKYERKLKDIEDNISDMENQFLKNEDPASLDEYRMFVEFREMRMKAMYDLKEAKNAPPECWEDVKSDVKQLIKELRQSIKSYRALKK